MSTTTAPTATATSAIRNGATLVAVAAAGFIGYAMLFAEQRRLSRHTCLARKPADATRHQGPLAS